MGKFGPQSLTLQLALPKEPPSTPLESEPREVEIGQARRAPSGVSPLWFRATGHDKLQNRSKQSTVGHNEEVEPDRTTKHGRR